MAHYQLFKYLLDGWLFRASTVNVGDTLSQVEFSVTFVVHALDADKRRVLMLVAQATLVAEHNALWVQSTGVIGNEQIPRWVPWREEYVEKRENKNWLTVLSEKTFCLQTTTNKRSTKIKAERQPPGLKYRSAKSNFLLRSHQMAEIHPTSLTGQWSSVFETTANGEKDWLRACAILRRMDRRLHGNAENDWKSLVFEILAINENF